MRCRLISAARALAALTALTAATTLLSAASLHAQRHGSVQPPAPPHGSSSQPIVAVSSGMGPIQFAAVNYGASAPQSIARQLRSDDERTRSAALSALGVPGLYLQRDHVAMPRSIHLELAALSNNDELDALLTVELDQHIVTAVLVPDDSNWRRIATLSFASSLDDGRTTPSTFLHTARAFLERSRYRAVFRAAAQDAQGNYVESEVNLRIFNDRPVITMSFASASRQCSAVSQPLHKHEDSGGCNILRRWFQPDTGDPGHRFDLITGSGHLSDREAADSLGKSRWFEETHLRSFSCQPFQFSETALRFEPTANPSPCNESK